MGRVRSCKRTTPARCQSSRSLLRARFACVHLSPACPELVSVTWWEPRLTVLRTSRSAQWFCESGGLVVEGPAVVPEWPAACPIIRSPTDFYYARSTDHYPLVIT